MALTNCTITSTSVSVTKDAALTSGTPNQVLVITPELGYVVSADNFTNNSILANSQVNNVTLSDSGVPDNLFNTVLVTVDLKDTFVPTTDLTITLDIDGAAVLSANAKKNVTVKISRILTNASIDSTTTTANVSGTPGELKSLFSRTITAGTGKYFETEPSIEYDGMDYSMYTVTSSNTMTTVGLASVLTAKTFNVSVSIPSFNVVGDDDETFTIKADASGVTVADTGIKKISALSTSVSPLGLTLTRRNLKVYGDVGAQVDLTITNTSGDTYDFSTNTLTGSATKVEITIPATGYHEEEIIYPKIPAATNYVIKLDNCPAGSDLAENSYFDSDDDGEYSVTVQALANVKYIVSATSASNRSYTSNGTAEYSGAVNYEVEESQVEKTGGITITDNQNIVLRRLPLLSDFTNTNHDGETGNSDINLRSITSSLAASSAALSATFNFTADLENFGSANSTSVLALDNFINTPPVAVGVSVANAVQVANNTVKTVQLTGSDADSDTLTYSTTGTAPTKGSVSISSTGLATYTPTGTSSSGADSFSFLVNDSYQDSHAVVVNLNIAVASSSPSPSFTSIWSYDDTEDNSTAISIIASQSFQGTPAYTNTSGSSFNATFSGWSLDNIHAGFPSYVDFLGDMKIKYRLKYGTTVVVDWTEYGTPNGSVGSGGATININVININIPNSHNSGSLVSGGAYAFDWLVEYENALQ